VPSFILLGAPFFDHSRTNLGTKDEGIDPMTNDEQQIAEAIARVFETLSEALQGA
jgi:hypothetical protein